MTVDDLTVLSNQYGFDNNYKWILYDEVMKDSNNVYAYDEFEDVPYYLYYGLRMGEGKYLANAGYLTDEEFMAFISENITNKEMIKLPNMDSNGNRLWTVTTSNDFKYKSSSKLYKEGSIYILPKAVNKSGKKFVGWYNMADGKLYKEGSLITIHCGTHFEAVYENR